jgi:serine protease Do
MTQTTRRTIAAVAAGLSLLLGPVPLAAEELPDIADRVQASVVSIAAERTDQTPPQATGEDADAAKSNLRQGSGMVLSADGYIVTATSLVEKVGKITVVFSDGKQASAQVTGRDPRTGIALLKLSGTAPLTAVHFADAHVLRRGTSVFSIGNVYGLQNSLSSGIVAAIRRASSPVVHLVLQTDMVVYPGSTGAPLFNMKGEVLGMFTSNYSNAGKRTGIGLAVTSNLIREVTDKLQKFGVVDRGWLGLQVRKTTDEDATARSRLRRAAA